MTEGPYTASYTVSCVALYNKCMGVLTSYEAHMSQEKKKIYKYIFFDVVITNAYVFHSYNITTTVMDHKCFRMMLANFGDYMSCKRPGRPYKCSRPTPPHLPSHSKSRSCAYCIDFLSAPRRKESVWICRSDCFRLWHEQ